MPPLVKTVHQFQKSSNLKRISRGGDKLDHALNHFNISLQGRVCVDLGSNVGGFVECLLEHGTSRVHSVDTNYGTLAWKLRQDPRVIVHERTNALHFVPEEAITFVSIDVGWTPQAKILPAVFEWLKEGEVVSLLKPQYESTDKERIKGKVKAEYVDTVVERTLAQLKISQMPAYQITPSPILGGKGNKEYLLYFKI